MQETLVPIVIMTGMFAMIFGIVYLGSRERMSMIEKGMNPRQGRGTPKPFISLKYGLLLIGCGLGLLSAYIIDNTMNKHDHSSSASITIGSHHSAGNNKAAITDTTHMAKDTALAVSNASANNSTDNDDDDDHSIAQIKSDGSDNPSIYFALIAIGGGIGLVISYSVEKKWLDKNKES